MTLGTTGWTLSGIYLTTSDAMYEKLLDAVTTGNLSIDHLRQITGHRYPIIVDLKRRHIELCSF